jgi:hypothetical protein
MSPGGAQPQQAELTKMLEGIRTGRDQAYQHLETVHSGVNRFLWVAGSAAAVPVLGPIAPATIWWVYHNWDKIKAACAKIFKVLDTVLTNGFPVLSLIHHSFAWVEEVLTPSSALAFEVGERANLNLMEWAGKPADRYKEIQTQQKAALGEMVTRANHISKWMLTIVQGNLKYAEQVYKIVTSLVGALVAAAVKVGTIITIPLALDTLETQLGKIVESELNLLMTIAQRVVDSLAGLRDTISITGNQTILGPSGWPEAVRGQ